MRAYLHPLSPECRLSEWISHLHSRPEVTQALRHMLATKDLLEAAAVAQEIRHMLRLGLEGTWYTTDPTNPVVYRTHFGTVPGAPLADLMFVMTYTVCIDSLLQSLHEAGLHCVLAGPDAQEVTAPAPTWLDDTAILIRSTCSERVESDMAAAARLARTHLATIGIPLNLIRGKSEALIVTRGMGARLVRQDLFIQRDSMLDIGEGRQLAITDRYVHLGSMQDHRASPTLDISRRAAAAESVYKPLQKRLLRNPALGIAEKRLLLEGMIFQKFLFGMERWSLTRQQDWTLFRTHYMSFVRRSLRPLTGLSSKLLTDAQVCCLLSIVGPAEARHIQLARALHQALSSDMSYLHLLLQQERIWVTHAINSTNAVCATLDVPGVPEMPLAAADLEAWRSRYRDGIADVAALLRRYRQHSLRAVAQQAEAVRGFCAYRAQSEASGVMILHGAAVTAASQDAQYPCSFCQARFASKAAAAAHMQKVHGSRATASVHARGTACQACGKEFWSTERLRDHLRHQARCLSTHAEADLPEAADHERRCRATRYLPATALVGPRPFWATLTPPPRLPEPMPLVDPELQQLQSVLQLAEATDSHSQIFHKLAPKLLRLHRTFAGLSSAHDELLLIGDHAHYARELSVAMSHSLSTECEQPLADGWLRVKDNWVIWRPQHVPFSTDAAGLGG